MGLMETFVLLPGKDGGEDGLLCRVVSKDQLLPSPLPKTLEQTTLQGEMTMAGSLNDLKFDL